MNRPLLCQLGNSSLNPGLFIYAYTRLLETLCVFVCVYWSTRVPSHICIHICCLGLANAVLSFKLHLKSPFYRKDFVLVKQLFYMFLSYTLLLFMVLFFLENQM